MTHAQSLPPRQGKPIALKPANGRRGIVSNYCRIFADRSGRQQQMNADAMSDEQQEIFGILAIFQIFY
jgi:hypothetical protein